ncbi:hypothetical protein HNY73_009483 [Argiope bruennichi]|uniref:Uncharacterized protein n=1 Tax=Argiope bruennichi TaxID=94029 RepID=A0A8T0FC78_ARGBR|nr:hypothetical protein HNY73_009483 [Argiope bruennichi]
MKSFNPDKKSTAGQTNDPVQPAPRPTTKPRRFRGLITPKKLHRSVQFATQPDEDMNVDDFIPNNQLLPCSAVTPSSTLPSPDGPDKFPPLSCTSLALAANLNPENQSPLFLASRLSCLLNNLQSFIIYQYLELL